MRFVVVSAVGILTVGVLTASPASAAPRDPLQEITAASPRAASEYDDGLRRYYAGELDRAEKDFQEAIRRDPKCALAYWGLSRLYQKQGKTGEALTNAVKASDLAAEADDREKQLTAAWKKYLQCAVIADAAAKKREQDNARRDLDLEIAIYPGDQEIWLLRGDMAESPLRAVPFYLAALRIRPDHPFAKVWSPPVTPAPQLTPAPTKPVPPVTDPPKLLEGLGNLTHPVTTSNPQAQAYYEQGLRCWHSYVAPMRNKQGAGVNFQHAANLDPECAMAYWGLSFCVQQGDVMSQLEAANRALELSQKKGSDKERRFCAARVLELTPNKREECLDAIDAAIAAYPDDVELWIWRGKIYTGYNLGGNVVTECLPYQIAANRMHPEHPAPNHELIHGYERIDRPALGWPYTVGFRQAAPNMPHANHMQAHLAMRLGRWEEALDDGRTARKKSLAGFPELDPTHHIDIMVRALAHEGLFKEADAEPRAYRDGLPWARLLQLKGINSELDEWAQRRMSTNSQDGFYIGAIAKLDRNDLPGAAPLVAKVEEQWNKSKNATFYRYNEVKGRYLVQSGNADEGFKLLKEAATRAVKDNNLHAWGGGSYVLEVWGEAALRTHRWDDAEEAYSEALAHEHGSILGALGLQVVWENRGRSDMAAHYAARAATIWKNADPGVLDRQLERLRKLAAGSVASR